LPIINGEEPLVMVLAMLIVRFERTPSDVEHGTTDGITSGSFKLI
jgi:hypothetical protein